MRCQTSHNHQRYGLFEEVYMKLKIAGVLIVLTLAGAGLALGEDQIAEPQAPLTVAPQENNDANTQWVWGEVAGVDVAGKTITLKYLDYETDQEKEIVLTADDSTTFDNVKSLGEIQVKDNLSVDYASKDGKNTAKSVSLEKTENAPAVDTATTQPDAANMVNKTDTTSQPSQANQ